MPFKGMQTKVADKIRGWRLSMNVAREFALRLVDDLERKSPQDLPVNERGMFHRIQVQDPDFPAHYYVFEAYLRRNDMDFWVADCECVGIDRSGKIFWSSKS